MHPLQEFQGPINDRAPSSETFATITRLPAMQTPAASIDRAYGALLGACCGDAAGSPLEFLGRAPFASEVKMAMSMPGGVIIREGNHRVAPGQVTDDGELTIAMARGLLKCLPGTYSLEPIARMYGAWAVSAPFGTSSQISDLIQIDMGITTRASIGCVVSGERNGKFREEVLNKKGYAFAMQNAAKFDHAETSKANGSLMRATPIGVWGHRLTDAELAELARLDCSLSHPNTSVAACGACYSIAIAELVAKPEATGRQAFERAKAWAQANAPDEVKQWLLEAETNNVTVPYHPHGGFIRIAFSHAFRHLLLGTPYAEAVAETLIGGGDTDTNACIVGGLVGAAQGASAIPAQMARAVLSSDTSKCKPRPELFHPHDLQQVAVGLVAAGAQLASGTVVQASAAPTGVLSIPVVIKLAEQQP